MRAERNGQRRASLGTVLLLGLGLGLGLALGGCGSSGLGSSGLGGSDLLGSSSAAGSGDKPAAAGGGLTAAAANETPCPDIEVRNGAATLMIGSKPGEGEPSPLDVRYQGTIVRLARECHLNAGLLTIKVGVEGRIITGPAGIPGTVNVPLRITVMHDAIQPKTVVSRFATIPVTVNSPVDRVTFTHIDRDIAFPAPNPISLIDSYVIYVGFDPLGARQQKKPTRKRRVAPRARS